MKHFPSFSKLGKGLASRKLWAFLVVFGVAGLLWLLVRWGALPSGFNPQITTLKPNQVYRPAKTLWDWLQLAGIPVALAFIAYLFQDATKKLEQRIALENQRNDILQKYVDAMSELILSADWTAAIKEFRVSRKRTNQQTVARARTQVALSALQSEPPDVRRRGQIIRFLAENELLQEANPGSPALVSLYGTDLGGVDLARADLSRVDLKGVDLTGADLSCANLQGISENSAAQRRVYGEAELYTTKFDSKWQLVSNILNGPSMGRDLTGTDLSNAFLAGARLGSLTLCRVDFRGANLKGASLFQSDLRGADFRGAVLDLADLLSTRINWRTRLDPKWKLVWRLRCQHAGREDFLKNLGTVDLSHAYLFYAQLQNADLKNADLTNADLEEARLGGAMFSGKSTLIGTKFETADLTGCHFDGCYFAMCNLKKAKLRDASFVKAHCLFSDFDDADLTGAHLNEVEFSNVRLVGADFGNADFTGATFKDEVDATGATFRNATITREQLASIAKLNGAILPDGNRHP